MVGGGGGGGGNILGSKLPRICLFFQTVKVTVQKNFGLLFVCSCFVGLVGRSKKKTFFFWCKQISLLVL